MSSYTTWWEGLTPEEYPEGPRTPATDPVYLCHTCGLSEAFEGWDDCIKCGVAYCLAEDPDYLEWYRRTFPDKPHKLAALEREWATQSQALEVA